MKIHVVYPGVIDTELFHLPDNDPLAAPAIEMLPVDAMVEPVLDVDRDRTGFEVSVPDWFNDVFAGKYRDVDAFLDGTIAYVRTRSRIARPRERTWRRTRSLSDTDIDASSSGSGRCRTRSAILPGWLRMPIEALAGSRQRITQCSPRDDARDAGLSRSRRSDDRARADVEPLHDGVFRMRRARRDLAQSTAARGGVRPATDAAISHRSAARPVRASGRPRRSDRAHLRSMGPSTKSRAVVHESTRLDAGGHSRGRRDPGRARPSVVVLAARVVEPHRRTMSRP